jgi:hypothetical protein
MRRPVATILLAAFVGGAALGDVVVDQSYDGSSASRTAQEFPDFSDFSVFQLDDFTTTQEWLLTTLTVPGTETGDPNESNIDVIAELWSDLPEDPNCGTTGELVLLAHGTEDAATATLSFDFESQSLPPGTYWLRAYIVRNFGDHGLWKWYSTTPVSGSEAHYYNPGGSLGYGGCPIPGSERYGEQRDMAFRLEGTPVGGCPGDVDGDGDTDLSDLAALLAAYGSSVGDPGYNPDADLDGSGTVDLTDLALLLSDYGCS